MLGAAAAVYSIIFETDRQQQFFNRRCPSHPRQKPQTSTYSTTDAYHVTCRQSCFRRTMCIFESVRASLVECRDWHQPGCHFVPEDFRKKTWITSWLCWPAWIKILMEGYRVTFQCFEPKSEFGTRCRCICVLPCQTYPLSFVAYSTKHFFSHTIHFNTTYYISSIFFFQQHNHLQYCCHSFRFFSAHNHDQHPMIPLLMSSRSL